VSREPVARGLAGHEALFKWIVRGTASDGLPRLVEGFVAAQRPARRSGQRGRDRVRLPREALSQSTSTSPEVWAALLEDMRPERDPEPGDDDPSWVIAPGRTAPRRLSRSSLTWSDRKARATRSECWRRFAPMRRSRRPRGGGEWNPVREIVDALDAAFYTAFDNAEPTGKRLLLALDVSGSMVGGQVAGVQGLRPGMRRRRSRS